MTDSTQPPPAMTSVLVTLPDAQLQRVLLSILDGKLLTCPDCGATLQLTVGETGFPGLKLVRHAS